MDPPFRPDKDLNVQSQSAIGKFDSLPDVEIPEKWNSNFEKWSYKNEVSVEQEIIQLMIHEDVLGTIITVYCKNNQNSRRKVVAVLYNQIFMIHKRF